MEAAAVTPAPPSGASSATPETLIARGQTLSRQGEASPSMLGRQGAEERPPERLPERLNTARHTQVRPQALPAGRCVLSRTALVPPAPRGSNQRRAPDAMCRAAPRSSWRCARTS